jgi:methyl-accepting chemotaxis protein
MPYRIDTKNFSPSTQKVETYKEENRTRMDKKVLFFIFGYFFFGLALAYFYDTWFIAFVMGTALLACALIISVASRNTSANRYLYTLIFFAYIIQYILQTEGAEFVISFIFINLTILIFYHKNSLIAFFVILIVMYSMACTVLIFNGNSQVANYWFLSSEKSNTILAIYAIIFSIQLFVCDYFTKHINRDIEANVGLMLYFTEEINIEKNTEIAKKISDGDLVFKYQPKENDIIGNALVETRDKLLKMREQEERNRWRSDGLSLISNILLSYKEQNALTEKVLIELCKYLQAYMGMFFIVQTDKTHEYLQLNTYYAPQFTDKIYQTIEIGEGLVGECALRQQTIYLTNIPDNYQFIHSGLGEAKPQSILLVPISHNSQLLGVIEMAFFKECKPHEIAFLEEIASGITVTLFSAKAAETTNRLLYETQIMNEKMRIQTEESQKNIAVIVSEQEEMKLLKEELEKKVEDLQKENQELRRKIQTDKMKADEQIEKLKQSIKKNT